MFYKHQQEFLDSDNDRAILTWEAGTGKTFTSKYWLQQKNRMDNPVVLCPKQIKQDWQDAVPDAIVMTPYEFKKGPRPKNPSAVVVDEADMYGAPLFIAKKRSKQAETLYYYLADYPQAHVLLLTATPVRSSPWNIHSLLIYTQKVNPEDWREYQKSYFSLEYKPYLPRPAWMPIKGWQKMMQPLLEYHTHIALMRDMVDILPPETHEIIKLKAPNYEQNYEWEPAKQFVEDHRLEQHTKLPEITRISKGYRKAVIVAHYRQQIDALQKELSKERETFVLDGRTKDVQQVIMDAEDSPECYLIIQASVGAGFDLHTFSCMIFVSQGYSVRNWVQMKARIRRLSSLKPVIYYYLHGGRCDKMIYNSIQAGRDFIPSEYYDLQTSEKI